ncbi:MAG: DUF4143 domain-containing protein [Mariniphaga sp.]
MHIICKNTIVFCHETRNNTILTANEGMLAEQFVAQELLTNNKAYLSPELFYWSREKKNSNAELDFIFQHKNKIYPVEVKAGKTGTLKSIQLYMYEKKLQHGIRFNMDLENLKQR